jgi:anti-anti-sigma regulatory factor
MVDDTPYESRITEPGRLVLTGSISEDRAPELLSTLLDAVAEGPLTVDLSGVDYLPSVALSAFVSAWHADGAHPMTLQAPAGSITQRVLAIAGLPYDELPV